MLKILERYGRRINHVLCFHGIKVMCVLISGNGDLMRVPAISGAVFIFFSYSSLNDGD